MEFVSAVHRKYREGVLSEEQLLQATEGFAEAIGAFHVEPLGRPVSERAVELIRTYGRIHALRSLDALHLATYVLIAEPTWRFVVADDRLEAVVLQEGWEVIHPVRDEKA